MRILTAAGVVIDGAIKVLAFAKRFTERNTPESALAVSLITIWQAAQTGTIPTGVAVVTAVTALTTFMIAEQSSDSKTTAMGGQL